MYLVGVIILLPQYLMNRNHPEEDEEDFRSLSITDLNDMHEERLAHTIRSPVWKV